MNSILKRIISILIVLCLSNSFIIGSLHEVYADIDLYVVDEATVLSQSEALKEGMEEAALQTFAYSSIKKSHDNFYQLHTIDGLAYNKIHIMVQNHIRKNNSKVYEGDFKRLQGSELFIRYTNDKSVLNEIYKKSWVPVLEKLRKLCPNPVFPDYIQKNL